MSMNLNEEIKIKSNNVILLPIYIQWYYKLFTKDESFINTNTLNKNSIISCTYMNTIGSNEQETSLDLASNDISDKKLLLIALLKHLRYSKFIYSIRCMCSYHIIS